MARRGEVRSCFRYTNIRVPDIFAGLVIVKTPNAPIRIVDMMWMWMMTRWSCWYWCCPRGICTHLRPAARQSSAVPPPVDPIDAQPHAGPDWHPIVVAAVQPHRCAAPSPAPAVAAARVACAACPARCRAPCLSMNTRYSSVLSTRFSQSFYSPFWNCSSAHCKLVNAACCLSSRSSHCPSLARSSSRCCSSSACCACNVSACWLARMLCWWGRERDK